MTLSLNWSNIETILLDMDGTLLDLAYDNYFWQQFVPRCYAQRNSITLDNAQQILQPMFHKQRGLLNWYCVDYWSEILGIDVMQLKVTLADKIHYRNGAENFLMRCKEKVGDLRLVTNAHNKVLEMKVSVTTIDRFFTQLISAHTLGAAKEQPEFWQYLHQYKPFNKHKTLLIDDNEMVLDTAAEYGIAHILSIANPDSSEIRRVASKYPMIDNFLDL